MTVEFVVNSGVTTMINNPTMQYYPVKVAVNTNLFPINKHPQKCSVGLTFCGNTLKLSDNH